MKCLHSRDHGSPVARRIFQAATFLQRANHIIISTYSCRYSLANCINAFRRGVLSLYLRLLCRIYPAYILRGSQLSAGLSATYTARRHDTVIYHRSASCGFSALLNEFHNRIKFSARARRAGPKRAMRTGRVFASRVWEIICGTRIIEREKEKESDEHR